MIEPEERFQEVKLFYLEECPRCKCKVAILERLDVNDIHDQLRFTGRKASDLFERLRHYILEDLDKPLNGTEDDWNHGEFTKTETKIVTQNGDVIERYKHKPMVITYLQAQ